MWIIKLFGAGLIAFAGLGLGVHSSLGLKRRANKLEWYAKAADAIGVKIESTAAEIYDIVRLLYGKDDYLVVKKPFSVEVDTADLTERESQTVNEFFSELGMGELEAQVKRCKTYAALLGELQRSAYSEYAEKARLYRILGLFAGVALAVIMV